LVSDSNVVSRKLNPYFLLIRVACRRQRAFVEVKRATSERHDRFGIVTDR